MEGKIKNLLVAAKSPFSEKANAELENIAKEGGLETRILKGHNMAKLASDPELREALAWCNALVVRSDNVNEEVIDAAPNLKLILRGGSGYNNIENKYCTQKGIIVENTPGQNSNAVAELAINMMLNLYRATHVLDASTKAGKFEKTKYKGRELKGKKLGLHGFGYVGQLVADKAKSFSMGVYTYDPAISQALAKDKGVTLVSTVEELYKDKDIVSVHIPLNKKTKRLVNGALLSLMAKDGALINTARGGIVNEDDLEYIMTNNPKFKFGADDYEGGDAENIVEEKIVPRRFAKFGERFIQTPHIGAGTEDANFNCAVAAARQAVAFNKGDISCAVNKDVVPPWMSQYAALAQILGEFNSYLIEGQPKEVRVICYEDLEKYQNAFAGNVLKGMFGREELKPTEALNLAQQNKIALDIRKPDNTHKHGDSITIDYFVGDDQQTQTASVRGTVTEGSIKISRIEEFKDVDFRVTDGTTVMFQYKEGEGMADTIGNFFTKAGYNKKSGIYTPSPSGESAIYVFSVQKKDNGQSYEEVKAITDKVKASVPEVYKAIAVDFTK